MSAARSELIAVGVGACRECLEAMGFRRHASDFFTLPLARGIFGWVSLTRAVHRGDGSMEITPWVGLLYPAAERLLARLAQLPYHRYFPATVNINIGLLTPDAQDLRVKFHPRMTVDVPTEQVCSPIRDVGIPWMRDHATRSTIYELVTDKRFIVALRPFKMPVIAWMLGRPESARQLIQDHLSKIRADGGRNAAGALEVYGGFAARLEELMAREA